jgi:hypothetical protein
MKPACTLIILLTTALAIAQQEDLASPAIGDNAYSTIKPYFTPPEAFRSKFGDYKSPLVFNDGSKVETPADWTRRRAEILEQWQEFLGRWPPLITTPHVETISTERRNNHGLSSDT